MIPLGGYSTVQDFESTLDIINFYGGERRMDRALEEAVGLFKKARPGVQRKVFYAFFSYIFLPFYWLPVCRFLQYSVN